MPFTANFKLPITANVATAPDLEQWVNVEIQQAYDAALADLLLVARDSGVIPLSATGANNGITATLPAGLAGVGVTISALSIVEMVAPFTNTGPVTMVVEGIGPFPVQHELGGALEAGDLRSGSSYLLRRRGSAWRIIQNGLRAEIGAVASGRSWVTSGSVLANQTPPKEAVAIWLMEGTGLQSWVKASAPSNGVETETLKRDATGQWWARKIDSRDINNGRTYTQYTANPSGKNIPVTANSVVCISGNTYSVWTPTAEPADGLETPVTKVDANGRWWRKVPPEVTSTGGVTFDPNTAFVNPDANDQVRYVIGRAQDESPLIGFYSDGSWSGSPFGSIWWPGDDNVVFETVEGNPVMAFRRDGTLIAKMEP